jgi:HEAT repeat protein
MVPDNIVPFRSQRQILEKAQAYVDSMEKVLEETGRAESILIQALRFAESDLKAKIILLLRSFANDRIAASLYDVIADTGESEEIRQSAAIGLNVVGSSLENPNPIIDRLFIDLRSPDPVLRRSAAFALGWEGNGRAAIPLIDLLYDTDIEVQQAAVNALSNINDDRILGLLRDRLDHGPLEQKQSILFNLWRFSSRRAEVTAIYLEFVEGGDTPLRIDALSLLDSVADIPTCVKTYRTCLRDREPQIRRLALMRLEQLPPTDRSGLSETVRKLMADPDPGVRQAALRFLGSKDPA